MDDLCDRDHDHPPADSRGNPPVLPSRAGGHAKLVKARNQPRMSAQRAVIDEVEGEGRRGQRAAPNQDAATKATKAATDGLSRPKRTASYNSKIVYDTKRDHRPAHHRSSPAAVPHAMPSGVARMVRMERTPVDNVEPGDLDSGSDETGCVAEPLVGYDDEEFVELDDMDVDVDVDVDKPAPKAQSLSRSKAARGRRTEGQGQGQIRNDDDHPSPGSSHFLEVFEEEEAHDHSHDHSHDHRYSLPHDLRHSAERLVAQLQHERRRRAAAEAAVATAQAREDQLRTRMHDLAAQVQALAAQNAALHAQANALHAEADRHRRGHERVLTDLHRFRAAQGVAQMADDFLVQRAQALRQDVRDFALQFYEGAAQEAHGGEAPTTAKLHPLLRSLGPDVLAFLASPSRRPAAVQAFVWVVLTQTVFHGWYWAGAGRRPLVDVCQLLREDVGYAVTTEERDVPDADADRRFYMWRATTARLVAERPSSIVRPALVRKLAEEIGAVLDVYRVDGHDDHDNNPANNDHDHDDHDDHAQELARLLHAAIEFDRDTAQQAARLEWLLPRAPASGVEEATTTITTTPAVPFDPAIMERDPSEAAPPPDAPPQCVLLAVAPGLRKRGRSNGEDFAVETVLLKMEVTCEGVVDGE